MLSRNIAPKYFWPVGMLVQLIPLLWIINIILLLIMILKKSRFFYFPLFIIIILSIFFFNSTFQLRNTEKSTASNSISVISYNASFFKKKTTFSKEYYDPLLNAAALEINNWLVLNEADVICVQEFFDDVNSDILNNIATITASGKYEYHFVYKQKHDNGIRQGLVIFSKYPIIDKGTVFISENNYNGAIYTDLKIKNDTVRIIDVHLESMRLASKTDYLFTFFRAYKYGVIKHNIQLEKLMSFIRKTPPQYKIILCGDLNETPYSFVYKQLNEKLNNAFENAGSGFGFSFNSQSLPLLRIDNQFYDPRLQIQTFKTIEECNASEHFPIVGEYSLQKKSSE